MTKSFGSHTVLEDITFDVPKGRITAILGPSGTGKSVLLKNILGLLRPERGEIWVDGDQIVGLREKRLYEVRKKFGVLFQDGALFGSMNLYDNIAFPLREHTRKNEAEIRELVHRNAELVGLMDHLKKLPGEVSGGMKKRAGLARAMVTEPEIVLFDEPDSGLDPVRVAYLDELVVTAQKETGATFFIITHNIQSVMRTAEYMGVLFRSNLVKFASKADMVATDNPIIQQFLAGRARRARSAWTRWPTPGGDASRYIEGDTAALAFGPLPGPARPRWRRRRRATSPSHRADAATRNAASPGWCAPGTSGVPDQVVAVSRRRRAAHTVSTMRRAHHVGVHVGVRPAVLEPPLLVLGGLPRDADGRAPVRRAVAELGVVRRLVRAGQPALDADAVVGDVLLDALPEGLAARDDRVPAAVLAHGLGGEVGVRAGTVPVTEHRLRLEGGEDVEVLGDAEEQPAGRPQLVADERRRQDADLELPLPHHHLGVGALDAQARPSCRPPCGARRSRGRASCRRRRRSSTDPAARGTRPRASPAAGRTGRRCTPARSRTTAPGRRTSRPSRRTSAGCWCGCGVMSVCSTSHMTSLSPSARSGSGQTKTGCRTQSESLPSAWFVLEPSKPQIGGSLPSSTIFVLLRSSGVGSVPSIQMYSAW